MASDVLDSQVVLLLLDSQGGASGGRCASGPQRFGGGLFFLETRFSSGRKLDFSSGGVVESVEEGVELLGRGPKRFWRLFLGVLLQRLFVPVIFFRIL
jgi:hypothetical protein